MCKGLRSESSLESAEECRDVFGHSTVQRWMLMRPAKIGHMLCGGLVLCSSRKSGSRVAFGKAGIIVGSGATLHCQRLEREMDDGIISDCASSTSKTIELKVEHATPYPDCSG
jgi:hypothetical protein